MRWLVGWQGIRGGTRGRPFQAWGSAGARPEHARGVAGVAGQPGRHRPSRLPQSPPRFVPVILSELRHCLGVVSSGHGSSRSFMFIEMLSTRHSILPFKVCGSVGFSMFTVSHVSMSNVGGGHRRHPEHFHHPKKKRRARWPSLPSVRASPWPPPVGFLSLWICLQMGAHGPRSRMAPSLGTFPGSSSSSGLP